MVLKGVLALKMTELLMFEVNVKNMTEKGREEGRGPAWVCGSDVLFSVREGLFFIYFLKLAFDQKGGGVGEKTNLLILFFIFLQTMNMASRLLDSWRTVKINHISTVHTIIKSLKR